VHSPVRACGAVGRCAFPFWAVAALLLSGAVPCGAAWCGGVGCCVARCARLRAAHFFGRRGRAAVPVWVHARCLWRARAGGRVGGAKSKIFELAKDFSVRVGISFVWP
jgi:hypothetical protein